MMDKERRLREEAENKVKNLENLMGQMNWLNS